MADSIKMVTLADKALIEATSLHEQYNHQTMYDVFKSSAEKFADRPALSFQLKSDPSADSETLSYKALFAEINKAANMYAALGLKPGETVALLLPSATETVIAGFAAQTIGIVNPINPLLEPEQIAAIMRESNAKILVTVAPFPKTDVAQKAAEAVALTPDITTILQIDLLRYLKPPLKWIIPFIRPKITTTHQAKVLDFNQERAKYRGDGLDFTPIATIDSIGAYFHTGGTTGTPKLAQHSQRGMVFNSWMCKHLLFEKTDVMLVALPLFHVFASYPMAMAAQHAGAHLVLITPAGFRGEGVMDNFWKLCQHWQATFFAAVPTALSALVQRPIDADVSSLRFALCGSAPMPRELFRQFEEMSGLKVLEGYGMTEATCVTSCNPPHGESRIGSVGLPLPYTNVRIVNPANGKDCKSGDIGEICFQGPHVFPGYKDEKRNANMFYQDKGERWLRTGDLGRIDKDGYVWITGRAKDLIIRGGHNIDPGLIEEALMEHPSVAFVGAIGQPDAHAGELPCAYVELNQGATVTGEELRLFCKDEVSERAACPVYVEVLDELPKTAVGKIFKPDLRKSAIARIYDAALTKAGFENTITVVEDKKLGLVAEVTLTTDQSDDQALGAVLDCFARPWRLHEQDKN